MRPPLCSYEECVQPATTQLTAHWTIFDWFVVDVCSDHVPHAVSFLGRRFVDDKPLVSITFSRYEWAV